MAFSKTPSAAVAGVRPELEGFAKYLVNQLWGPKGPPWGTTLTEIEDLVVALRDVFGEQILHQALQQQANDPVVRSEGFRDCPTCGRPTTAEDPEPRVVQTRGGVAEWQEPHEHCPRCRRAFFPSVEESGH